LGHAQDHDGHRGCNLERAQLEDAKLVGVRYTADTVWPEGFSPDDAGAEIVT
jgi:hypothetical protein